MLFLRSQHDIRNIDKRSLPVLAGIDGKAIKSLRIQSNQRFDLTIVIPAYMEEGRIGKTLDQLSSYLRSNKTIKNLGVEVIVVVADSSDRTREVVIKKSKKFDNFRLLSPGEKLGKGRDVQFGMLRAKGDAVIFMDADLATPLSHIVEFYGHYKEGYDIVIATRNLHKHHPNILRRMLSNGGNILFRIASGMWVEDSQCGFKLFTKEAAKLCFSKLKILGWGFDMEVLAIAESNKLKIRSIRVNDWEHMPEGTFDQNILNNFTISLMDLTRIVIRRVRGEYY